MLQVDRMAGLALPNIFVQNYLKGLGHETGSNILTQINSYIYRSKKMLKTFLHFSTALQKAFLNACKLYFSWNNKPIEIIFSYIEPLGNKEGRQ